MPDTASITIRKSMTYKGAPEEWVNTYHIDPPPGDHAAYVTLGNAIWALERVFLGTGVKLLGYYGYEAGNETSIVQAEFADLVGVNETGAQNGTLPPGDAAIWVRWKTPDRTSTGKPIYLRKYFHGIPYNSTQEQYSVATQAALEDLATKVADGSLPGGIKLCGPQGAVAGIHKLAPYWGHRDLKRTGKRPH